MQPLVQSQLGMDLAADSLSTWRRDPSFGAERFEQGERNADEEENNRRGCTGSAGTDGRTGASVVDYCGVGCRAARAGE